MLEAVSWPLRVVETALVESLQAQIQLEWVAGLRRSKVGERLTTECETVIPKKHFGTLSVLFFGLCLLASVILEVYGLGRSALSRSTHKLPTPLEIS
jgi:hypothetical protein